MIRAGDGKEAANGLVPRADAIRADRRGLDPGGRRGAGCVKRRYTIRTDPPGALVFVNGEEVGTTPVSRSFTFYGDREIVLVADGYQTQKVLQPLAAPWWDNGITDFVTENLVPATLRDERTFDYRMAPLVNPDKTDLVNRAQAVRRIGQAPPPPKRRTLLEALGLRRSQEERAASP